MADQLGEVLDSITDHTRRLNEAYRQVEAAQALGGEAFEALRQQQARAAAGELAMTYLVSPVPEKSLLAKNQHTGYPTRPDQYESIGEENPPFEAVAVKKGQISLGRDGFEDSIDFVGPEVPFTPEDSFRGDRPGALTPGYTKWRLQVPLNRLGDIRVKILQDGKVIGVWPPDQGPVEA